MKMTKTMKMGKRTKTNKAHKVRHLNLIAAQKTMKYQREKGDQEQRERENGIVRTVNKVEIVIQIVKKK